MIQFFRRIRQGLLVDRKFTRYALYALGEIALVVIGILIALQINNWNEDRKEDARELLVLKQLKNEYETNLAQLESKIEIRNQLISSAKDVLLCFGSKDEIHNDSLTKKLGHLILLPTFDPIQNDLVSSGNINILKNIELKRLLTNWTSDVIQLQETEHLYVDYVTNNVVPFFDKTGMGRNVYHAFWRDKSNLTILLDEKKLDPPISGKSGFEFKIHELLANKELESLVSWSITLNTINNMESESLRKRILMILDNLNAEIRRAQV